MPTAVHACDYCFASNYSYVTQYICLSKWQWLQNEYKCGSPLLYLSLNINATLRLTIAIAINRLAKLSIWLSLNIAIAIALTMTVCQLIDLTEPMRKTEHGCGFACVNA